LYATALSWSSDEGTRARRIGLVETWLWDKDSTVRERAASALGEMRAIDARKTLLAALGRERVSSVREALRTAVADIGESA
jgi:HEAT repeat protein